MCERYAYTYINAHTNTYIICIRSLYAAKYRNRTLHIFAKITLIRSTPCAQKSFVWKVSRHRSIYRLVLTCLHLFRSNSHPLSFSRALFSKGARGWGVAGSCRAIFFPSTFVLNRLPTFLPHRLHSFFLGCRSFIRFYRSSACSLYCHENFVSVSKSVLHLFYFNPIFFVCKLVFTGLRFFFSSLVFFTSFMFVWRGAFAFAFDMFLLPYFT